MIKINFQDNNSVKEFINNNESGIYSTKNESEEDITILLEKGKGMDVKILQQNGWTKVHEYDSDGYFVSETYEK